MIKREKTNKKISKTFRCPCDYNKSCNKESFLAAAWKFLFYLGFRIDFYLDWAARVLPAKDIPVSMPVIEEVIRPWSVLGEIDSLPIRLTLGDRF